MNLRPSLQHLMVTEPEHPITTSAEQRIATAIGLELREAGVELRPIDFDDQPLSEQEVNSSDAGDRDLSAQI